MEEITDYEFNFKIAVVGLDDYNDKFCKRNNGFKVRHLVLGLNMHKVFEVNEYYTKYELTESKKLYKLIEDCSLVIINDLDNFEKHSNLEILNYNTNKINSKVPLIMNQKFEIFMPNLNCFYPILDDKQMMAFSGILSSTRPYHEYQAPFIPSVNIFEIFSKGIFIGMFVNFVLLNKLKNNITLEVVNKGFLNLIYLNFNFFKHFLLQFSENLDKGESLFNRDYYNYLKTKDSKFLSMGNLELKFQENMNKGVKKIFNDDYKQFSKVDYIHDNDIKFNYDFHSMSQLFVNHKRDDLFTKFYNTETCVTPVLTLEEALNFQKNLNKSVILNDRMKNTNKLEKLIQIEKFFFEDLKKIIVIDLNAKVFENNVKTSSPKF